MTALLLSFDWELLPAFSGPVAGIIVFVVLYFSEKNNDKPTNKKK